MIYKLSTIASGLFICLFLAGCSVDEDKTIALEYAYAELQQDNHQQLYHLRHQVEAIVNERLRYDTLPESIAGHNALTRLIYLTDMAFKKSGSIYGLQEKHHQTLLKDKAVKESLQVLAELRKTAGAFIAAADSIRPYKAARPLKKKLAELEAHYQPSGADHFTKLPAIYALADHAALLHAMHQVNREAIGLYEARVTPKRDVPLQALVSARAEVVTAGENYQARAVLTSIPGFPWHLENRYKTGIKNGQVKNYQINNFNPTFTFDPELFPVVEKLNNNLEKRRIKFYFSEKGEFQNKPFSFDFDYYVRICR